MKALLLLVIILLTGIRTPAQTGVPDNARLVGYFRERQFTAAARYLEPFSRASPGDRRLLATLGYAYYQAGDLADARDCFSRLYLSDSTDLTACGYLGAISLKNRDYPRALRYFCELVEARPRNVIYNKQLAALWSQLGKEAAACYYYDAAYRGGGSGDPDIVAGLASGLVNQQLFTRADSILNASLAIDSAQGAILSERIRSAYLQQDYLEIFPLADKLAAMGDIRLSPFIFTAMACYHTHRYRRCVETCSLLIANGKSTRTVHYLQALAFKELKDYTHSLQALDECLASALSRDADNYFAAKGDIYELLHAPSRALRQYDTAYYIFHNPLELYNKARIYDVSLKSPRTALKYYRLYLRGRRDTIIPAEAAARRYAHARALQLAAAVKQASGQGH